MYINVCKHICIYVHIYTHFGTFCVLLIYFCYILVYSLPNAQWLLPVALREPTPHPRPPLLQEVRKIQECLPTRQAIPSNLSQQVQEIDTSFMNRCIYICIYIHIYIYIYKCAYTYIYIYTRTYRSKPS